jgi:molybdate transport system substrate-binding protein
MRLSSRFAMLSWLVLLTVPPAWTQTLRVAAAADLQYAMSDLTSQFGKQSGIRVISSYGSSGNFRSQIQNGAPFDLFFSADPQYPKQLVSDGFADGETLTVYAHGHLVLWAPAEEKLGLTTKNLEVLRDARVRKIAIANPELAPYGRAAVAALHKAGLYEALKAKLIYGENISQAAQFAQSGSAQIGILALSLTFAETMKNGEKWEVPPDLYPVIEQAAVVIRSSPNKKAAQVFLDFVMSREGQQILAKYGFCSDGGATK